MKPDDTAPPPAPPDPPADPVEPGVLPAPPAALDAVFPHDRLDLLARYAERLATDGVVRGLIGPREASRLWERHVVNCGLLAPGLPKAGTVADIGSGAGLPGLVLAIARPDVSVTLVEPLLRRTTFLEEVAADLHLSNVIVVRGRAEALHGREQYDVVTARAVAPLDRLLAWCMPLVAPHGALLAMKGESADSEVAGAVETWRSLGCADPVVEVLGADLAADLAVDPIRVVRVHWADPARVSLPRSRDEAGSPGPRRDGSRKRRRKS